MAAYKAAILLKL